MREQDPLHRSSSIEKLASRAPGSPLRSESLSRKCLRRVGATHQFPGKSGGFHPPYERNTVCSSRFRCAGAGRSRPAQPALPRQFGGFVIRLVQPAGISLRGRPSAPPTQARAWPRANSFPIPAASKYPALPLPGKARKRKLAPTSCRFQREEEESVGLETACGPRERDDQKCGGEETRGTARECRPGSGRGRGPGSGSGSTAAAGAAGPDASRHFSRACSRSCAGSCTLDKAGRQSPDALDSRRDGPDSTPPGRFLGANPRIVSTGQLVTARPLRDGEEHEDAANCPIQRAGLIPVPRRQFPSPWSRFPTILRPRWARTARRIPPRPVSSRKAPRPPPPARPRPAAHRRSWAGCWDHRTSTKTRRLRAVPSRSSPIPTPPPKLRSSGESRKMSSRRWETGCGRWRFGSRGAPLSSAPRQPVLVSPRRAPEPGEHGAARRISPPGRVGGLSPHMPSLVPPRPYFRSWNRVILSEGPLGGDSAPLARGPSFPPAILEPAPS